MATTKFKDGAGREWDCAFTVDGMRRAKARGVNLGDPDTLALHDRLYVDPVVLCDAIFGIVEPVAKERGVTQAQFDAAMAGDVVEQAHLALVEAILVFTPSPRAKWAREVIETWRAVRDNQAETPSPSGATSSSAPASPASTQAP